MYFRFFCNKIIAGAFPTYITGTMQYGDNLESLVIALNTSGMMGRSRTHYILGEVFGIQIIKKSQLDDFSSKHDEIISKSREQNPLKKKQVGKRGRQKKEKSLALAECLAKYKAEVCLFTKDCSIPFDNNQTERDVRWSKSSKRWQAASEQYKAQIPLQLLCRISVRQQTWN